MMKRNVKILGVVILATLWVGLSPCVCAPPQHHVAALGDSLTDEYFEPDLLPPYDYAKSWFQLIVEPAEGDEVGRASGGDLPDETWGEPRRTGYEYNFARYGAIVEDLPDQVNGIVDAWPPSPGIGPQNHFVGVAIGANNFFPSTTSPYHGLYNEVFSFDDVRSDIDQTMDTARQQLDTLLAQDMNVVVANVPDYGIAPYTYYSGEPWAGYTIGDKREHVDVAVSYVNQKLAELAGERGLPLIDIYGLTKVVFGDNIDLDDMDLMATKQLGGVNIHVRQPDVLDNNGNPTNPQAAWVHDGIHPHTTIQGVFANLFMEASNLRYGTDFQLFSEKELLENAGLSYGGADTLFTDAGLGSQYSGYSDFITVPEPSTFWLGLISLLTLATFGWRRWRHARVYWGGAV